MRRWEQGRTTVEQLLGEQRLQRVTASREHADALLEQARRYVASARLVAGTDADAAFVLGYDAARSPLVNVTFAIPAGSMPCADNSTICARRHRTTEP